MRVAPPEGPLRDSFHHGGGTEPAAPGASALQPLFFPQRDVRTFDDPEGRQWSVWSVTPSRKANAFLPETMTGGWLCFETEDEKRRLHPISEGWDELPPDRLWELCRSAEPARRRTEAGRFLS